LVGAFNECMGRYVGSNTGDTADLMAAAEPIIGKLMTDHHDPFLNAVAAVLRDSRLAAAYKPAGITARQLAETLDSAASGLKEHCRNREEFVTRLAVAVRVICAPLAGR
jgi:TetR/AcrR family transcriptional regulator, regulator of autoinduction and epiphytic fitness